MNRGGLSPKYTMQHTLISGLPARRFSYTSPDKSGPSLEGVCVQDGQSLWDIHVVCRGGKPQVDARRIIDSVRYDLSRVPTTRP
jgi:hypothetical protein